MGIAEALLILEDGEFMFSVEELEEQRAKDDKDKLNFWQRLKLSVCGYIYLRQEKRQGWKGHLPIYLVLCKKHGHGYFEDYPHGYNQRFNCPKCLEEKVKKSNKE